MIVEIAAPTPEGVTELCVDLRARERKAFGVKAEQELSAEINRSVVSFASLVDGKCVAIWGARSSTPLSDTAMIWLVCSRQSMTLPITFMRHSLQAVKDLQSRFRLLYGYVLEDFDASVRWLKWLEFTVDPPTSGVRLFYKER